MAMWDGGDFGPVVKRWRWEERRVWWPFLQCERSYKFLFLKKAYYGNHYSNQEYYRDMWLSKEEFLFAQLRGDFDAASS
jgi:hypothetical protein